MRYVLKFVILFMLLFISGATQAQGSKRIGLFIGAGLPEFIHGGIKLQYNQLEAGGFYGAALTKDPLYSAGAHVMWHFGGESDHFFARPWYVKTNVIFNREENSKYIWKTWFSGIRFGREIAFNEYLSLQLDVGASFVLDEDKISKQSDSGSSFSLDIPVFPAASVGLFIRK